MKLLFTGLSILLLAACGTIKTEHTVHITMDVNLKIDKELDDFFGDLDTESQNIIESSEM